jgi:hypothetical protein
MAEQRIGMNERIRATLAQRRTEQTPALNPAQRQQRERDAAARAEAEAACEREAQS